jgi:hypothetical protein
VSGSTQIKRCNELAYLGQPKRAIIREVPDKLPGMRVEIPAFFRWLPATGASPLALAIEDGQDFEIPAQPRPRQFATAESE